jgi:hypothetical protein
MAALPGVLVLVNDTSTLKPVGTDRLSVPPSLAVLPWALIEKCAVGPVWKVNVTAPVAVELSPLPSVTASVTVLLAALKLNVHVGKFPQTGVPLFFQA